MNPHSKGPWIKGTAKGVASIPIQNRQEIIGHVWGVENAQLVTAAPELLAVLKKWEQFMATNYNREDISFWDETVKAINKAEGRSE